MEGHPHQLLSRDMVAETNAGGHVPRLRRLTLGVEQAPRLLAMLADEGINGLPCSRDLMAS